MHAMSNQTEFESFNDLLPESNVYPGFSKRLLELFSSSGYEGHGAIAEIAQLLQKNHSTLRKYCNSDIPPKPGMLKDIIQTVLTNNRTGLKPKEYDISVIAGYLLIGPAIVNNPLPARKEYEFTMLVAYIKKLVAASDEFSFDSDEILSLCKNLQQVYLNRGHKVSDLKKMEDRVVDNLRFYYSNLNKT